MKRILVVIILLLLVAACVRQETQETLEQAPTTPPTSAPVDTTTSAAKTYLEETRNIVLDFQEVLDTINAQIEMYQVNDQWLQDSDWRNTTLQAIDDLNAIADRIDMLPEAPPELSEIDRNVDLLAEAVREFASNLSTGILNEDKNGIDRARINREDANRFAENIAHELANLKGE